ncbi:MAG TPA: phosphatidate cytidylyltransferase [Burkholderiaceae bacterium]|nr:phosphatidate cytidylyltransferase [Burkholderiaceae bacterium]
MLRQRVATASVLLIVGLGALVWSSTAFAVVVTALFGLALAEWLQLTGAARSVSIVVALTVGAILLAVLLGPSSAIEAFVLPLGAIAVAIWIAIVVLLVQPQAMKLRLPRTVGMSLAVVLMLAAWFALMRFLSQGVIVLFSVLLIVWIADTAAYFAGRAFGRRKLAPHISPGKTWAGVGGAVFAVLLLALVIWLLVPDRRIYSNNLFASVGPAFALFLLALLVALSIAGDLFESLLKRQAGVKDSGQLLPGHGGVLDRVDAMLPLLPSAVVIQWLFR